MQRLLPPRGECRAWRRCGDEQRRVHRAAASAELRALLVDRGIVDCGRDDKLAGAAAVPRRGAVVVMYARAVVAPRVRGRHAAAEVLEPAPVPELVVARVELVVEHRPAVCPVLEGFGRGRERVLAVVERASSCSAIACAVAVGGDACTVAPGGSCSASCAPGARCPRIRCILQVVLAVRVVLRRGEVRRD